MSLESEARKQLEAHKRAAQEQERQRLAQQQAQEARKRASNLEVERVKSEAISKFRGLNPERLLEEVRRTWGCGQILHFSDPQFKEIAKEVKQSFLIRDRFLELDGVLLHQRSNNPVHSRGSHPAGYGGGYSADGTGSPRVWFNATSFDSDRYDVDLAAIVLFANLSKIPDRSPLDYTVILTDGYGSDTTRRVKEHLSFFRTKDFTDRSYVLYNQGSFTPTTLLNLDSLTPGNIRDFFVKTTANRMEGRGNIRIR